MNSIMQENIMKRSAERQQNHLSNDYDDLASTYFNLASVLHTMNQHTEAIQYYEKSIKICESKGYFHEHFSTKRCVRRELKLLKT